MHKMLVMYSSKVVTLSGQTMAKMAIVCFVIALNFQISSQASSNLLEMLHVVLY
jgi:hypothetical protein